jgi:hypothetical protein
VTDFFGGGLVFAVAAALWIAYLIPSWMRRRNFNASSTNTARMQQALREISDPAPASVSGFGDLTSRERKRALHQAELAARAQLRYEQQRAKAERHEENEAISKHRRRTMRLIAFIFCGVSVLGTLAGIALVDYTGNPALLYGGLGGFMLGLLALQILSGLGKKVRRGVTSDPIAPPLYNFESSVTTADTRSWTPQPLPRPLHLQTGSLAQATVAQVSMAERIRQAAREEALRARMNTAVELAETARVGAQVEQTVEPVSAPLDLDEVFRRRAAG